MTFAHTIAELRKTSFLNQKAFGQLFGVSGQQVGKWERGEDLPSIDKVIQIADYFEKSVDDLLGRQVKVQKSYENSQHVSGGSIDKLIQKNLQADEKANNLNISDVILEDYIQMKKRIDELTNELFKCNRKVIELLESRNS